MQEEIQQESMIENLKAAACDPKLIDRCVRCMQEKNIQKLRQLLRHHRNDLLDHVHQYEQCICRLDYFTYQLDKKEEWRNKG